MVVSTKSATILLNENSLLAIHIQRTNLTVNEIFFEIIEFFSIVAVIILYLGGLYEMYMNTFKISQSRINTIFS